jgi:putative endonuclease
MSDIRSLGRESEDRAAEYLIGLGYTIVTRRTKTRRGELDIVALDGETLVFVEVKARQAPGYNPEDSLGSAKLAALQQAVGLYIAAMEVAPTDVRLDLIAIDRDGLRHHKDIWAL